MDIYARNGKKKKKKKTKGSSEYGPVREVGRGFLIQSVHHGGPHVSPAFFLCPLLVPTDRTFLLPDEERYFNAR